jgi:quercetin dioxygenase-like cupin family protein
MSKYLIEPGEGEVHQLGQLGVRILHADPPGTGVTILEHPITPRGFASAVHTHTNEDEFSWIIAGTVGFDIGGDVFEAGPGAFVSKPRGIPHAFWNASSAPARVCEIISPAGFERFFVELATAFAAMTGPPGPEDFAKVIELSKKYDLDNDLSTVPVLMQKYGLVM